jgi:hypothetical protein
MDHVSTSYVERQNLQMRMSMRRFTPDQRAQQEAAQSPACNFALFHVLQLDAHSFSAAHHARDGGRPHGSRLERRRNCRDDGRYRAQAGAA